MGKKEVLEKFQLLIVVFGIFFASISSAQTHITLSQATVYDQNIFRNYLEAPDWVNQTSLNLQYDFKLNKLSMRLDYSGDLNLFYNYRDLLSQSHQIGTEVFFPLKSKIEANIGTDFQLRKFQSEYEIYDYTTLSAYAQLRWNQWQSNPVQIGYRFRSRDYNNLTELSYREHFIILTVKHFFPTKTTFIGELNYGAKAYTNQHAIEKIIVVPKKNPSKGKGHQYGMGHGGTITDTSIVAYNMTALKGRQMNLSLKLAQSIFSKTGISVEFTKRYTPANNARYLRGQDYSYNKDDDLYDDPYTYGSDGWQITFTQLLPMSTNLKVYVNFYDKKYPYPIGSDSTQNWDLSNTERKDQQKLFGIILSKQMGLNKMIRNITIYFSCDYLNNRSNDLYFQYEGYFIAGGFDLNF